MEKRRALILVAEASKHGSTITYPDRIEYVEALGVINDPNSTEVEKVAARLKAGRFDLDLTSSSR